MKYAFTEYLETKVLAKRPYLSKAMFIQVAEAPIRKEVQQDGERVRTPTAAVCVQGASGGA